MSGTPSLGMATGAFAGSSRRRKDHSPPPGKAGLPHAAITNSGPARPWGPPPPAAHPPPARPPDEEGRVDGPAGRPCRRAELRVGRRGRGALAPPRHVPELTARGH